MLPALRAALEGDAETGGVRQVVFVTDGLVGNEDQLFALPLAEPRPEPPLHRGDRLRPERPLHDQGRQFGRGTYTYIGSPGEVGEKMGALFRKLEHPVLGDVAVSWGGDDVETWPARVPDLYLGEPVVLLARLGATASAELTVTGRRDAEPWEATPPGRRRPRRDGHPQALGAQEDRRAHGPGCARAPTAARCGARWWRWRSSTISSPPTRAWSRSTSRRPGRRARPGGTANVPVEPPRRHGLREGLRRPAPGRDARPALRGARPRVAGARPLVARRAFAAGAAR